VTRECTECGTTFTPTPQTRQQYCTPRCRQRSVDRAKRGRNLKPCAWCGKQFGSLKALNQATCSRICRAGTEYAGTSSPIPLA
jgi:hypothetical protein